ncbi:MAG: tyrosine-type recombinase/integrase [Chloroflexota bacterium]
MSSKTLDRALASETKFFNISSIALRDAWTDFILARQAMGCTAATLKNYRYTLGRFIAWLEGQGVTAPQDTTARRVREYLAQFSGKSGWYANGNARAIRTLLRFWHKEGYLAQPVTFDMPKVHQKRLPFLTADQVKTVLAVCDARERAIILLLVDSGLRRQEAINLNRADVDLVSGAIRVRQGKGRKDRLAVIGAATRRELLKYWRACPDQAENAPALQTESGGRFTPAGLRSLLARLARRSGVKVSPHALRRTFATLALQGGMDLVSLQMLLGHADLSTTRGYIQWLDGDLLEAHRRSSPVDFLGHGGGKNPR